MKLDLDLAAFVNHRPAIRNAFESDTFRVRISNESSGPLEFLVMDGIGTEGSTARDVAAMLAENKGRPVNVRINSPGGLVFDGLGIFNALVLHDAPVTTTVEGLAASAAAIIALAGKPVRIMENANMFFHRAMGLAFGNRDVMLDIAETLEKIDESLAGTIANRRGLQRRDVRALMVGKVDGTVLSAAEAKKAGLADEIISLAKSAKNELLLPDIADQAVADRDRWLAEARIRVEKLALASIAAEDRVADRWECEKHGGL